jgi:S-adenosylmethionine decarboxylase proenzyme
LLTVRRKLCDGRPIYCNSAKGHRALSDRCSLDADGDQIGYMAVKVKITHLAIELKDCRAPIADSKYVERELRTAVGKTRLTVLHSHFHDFRPTGTTGLILLKESHVTIHTWPEHNYASVDIVTCGDPKDASTAFDSIVKSFRPKKAVCKTVRRGLAG